MSDREGHFSELERETLRNEQLEHEITRLRAENEALRERQGGFVHLDDLRKAMCDCADENAELRAEIERLGKLGFDMQQASEQIGAMVGELHELKDDNNRLRAENEALQKCCTQRGARMQIMREFIKRNVITDSFGRDKLINECPEAAGWFDTDGVPVEVPEDE